jgi:biopolymer transport protein ExbD
MKIARTPPKKARIEIIPMIDTVFFLLVFFMIATLSMITNNGLSVNLPDAQGGRISERQSVRTLTLTKDNQIYYDKDPVASSTEIKERLLLHDGDRQALVIIINADRSAEHGKVIELMDAVRQAGIAQLAIAVNPS